MDVHNMYIPLVTRQVQLKEVEINPLQCVGTI